MSAEMITVALAGALYALAVGVAMWMAGQPGPPSTVDTASSTVDGGVDVLVDDQPPPHPVPEEFLGVRLDGSWRRRDDRALARLLAGERS